jgi:hypothetical protein
MAIITLSKTYPGDSEATTIYYNTSINGGSCSFFQCDAEGNKLEGAASYNMRSNFTAKGKPFPFTNESEVEVWVNKHEGIE